ncbi:methylaspartate mutase [Streptacidiphilus jiangxiensis]|uniref:Methylaspartate mutase epsilon subunit n=1 Tax=Streptacidiphilus jiangxiensis TaxID=235985 RepID=A0A1H7VLM7_STRJI|nr:methylaspartate mutase [Streptacidiphilus jiangxiensis]SEM10143.1 methylaspartate mutase epsilon subunit [Streptacidiphilus jiangxiensis]
MDSDTRLRGNALPKLAESAAYITSLGKPTAAEVLDRTRERGRVAIQPRCGVGGHAEMLRLLRTLEAEAAPDILTVTIDSHTRLRRFQQALRALNQNPADLNGYPLVTHGWRRGRELNEAVAAPLEIRHGSPDAELLFGVSVAAGITSFEGGGISYNLPYSKDVPLAESLAAWTTVDRVCGELAELGIVIDRELFGTLTAVLVPPSISLAISVLEAVLAARAGVRCISVAYPQGGHLAQDVAALRAIPLLATRYLPAGVTTHAVLHEFMGVFPRRRGDAEDLILYGALVARLGGATKIITKTHQEAAGIPDTQANVEGLRLADRANSPLLDFLSVDEARVQEELEWILAEVDEIVGPVLDRGEDLAAAVVEAFADGTLDIPFSASRHARSEVIPARDKQGAIRYLSAGRLPLSPRSTERHRELLGDDGSGRAGMGSLLASLTADVNYFPRLFEEYHR